MRIRSSRASWRGIRSGRLSVRVPLAATSRCRRVPGASSPVAPPTRSRRYCRTRAETDVSSSWARMRAILWVCSSTDTVMFFMDRPHRNHDSQYMATGFADTNAFHCPNGCLRGGRDPRAIPTGWGRIPVLGRQMYPEMDRTKAFEVAKAALRETFDPEGHKNYALEGWEDGHDCWLVLLSTVSFQPEGAPGYTLSQLLGGRRTYYKVTVDKVSGAAQGVQPIPNPYAVAQSTDT